MSSIPSPPPDPIAAGIDWNGRVRDFQLFGEAELGLFPHDSSLIALTMLKTAPAEPPWVILDSTSHGFWPILNKATLRFTGDHLVYMADLRSVRPRKANERIIEVLEDRLRPRVFQDHQYSVTFNHRVHQRNRYPDLEGECLRANVVLNWMIQPNRATELEFCNLLGRVLTNELRDLTPLPIPNPPEALLNAVKLAVIGNPNLNPSAALRNALILPCSHAVLHGRNRLLPIDHQLLYRVLRESMLPWTFKILQALSDGDGYQRIKDICEYTALPTALVVQECARMADEPPETAAVDWPKLKKGSGKGGKRQQWVKLNESNGVGQDMRAFIRSEMRWWN